jgi:hypothetical protein
MKKKIEMRLITLSQYCKPIFEKVKKGELSKEDAFDLIEKYDLFLSKKVTLDMFVGENYIFKGFEISYQSDSLIVIFKGNKYAEFTPQQNGGWWNNSWSIVTDLIKNDVDYIGSF